jgi:uncharacterized membrane protein YoaK (UPF0700 family)
VEERLRALTPLLVALTFVTGVVEAASLLQLGRVFTAMQTGNVLFLAFGALGEGGLSTLGPSVSLGSFALGTVLGARMESKLESRRHRWFLLALVAEGLLISIAGFAAWGLGPSHRSPSARHVLVIAVLAIVMGMRNVTTMRARVPGLPTTLVTTTATTALLSGSPLGHDPELGYKGGVVKVRLASVLAMFAGGLSGAYLVHLGLPVSAVLFPAAAVVLALAAVFSRRPRIHET